MHLSDILRERLTHNGCGGMEQQAQGVQTRCGGDLVRKGARTFAPLAPTGLLGVKQGCCGAFR